MVKIQIIEKLFLHIVYFSYLLLPFGFLFSKSKKKDIIPITIAIYGIVFFLLLQLYQYLPRNTKTIYQSFYTYFEYLVFAFFFWSNINSKNLKKLILVSSALFFIFQLVYINTIKVNRLDSIPIGIETILLLVYIFFFFFEFSKSLNGSYIYNHYCFWISVGILIYLGGSFFFYILIDHLTKEQVNTFGNMTFVAEFIKNLLFVVALLIYAKHPKKTNDKSHLSVPYLDMI